VNPHTFSHLFATDLLTRGDAVESAATLTAFGLGAWFLQRRLRRLEALSANHDLRAELKMLDAKVRQEIEPKIWNAESTAEKVSENHRCFPP
jgi:hypothetical protein